VSARSKKHLTWHKQLRRYLLEELQLSQCESCGTRFNLTIMHATKRRFIQSREDYFRAALVCQPEHQSYDEGTGENVHERMAEFVDRLIERRGCE